MEKQDEITPQDKFNHYLDLYLSNKRNNQDELEVRFGTKYYNPITKIDFENTLSLFELSYHDLDWRLFMFMNL